MTSPKCNDDAYSVSWHAAVPCSTMINAGPTLLCALRRVERDTIFLQCCLQQRCLWAGVGDSDLSDETGIGSCSSHEIDHCLTRLLWATLVSRQLTGTRDMTSEIRKSDRRFSMEPVALVRVR